MAVSSIDVRKCMQNCTFYNYELAFTGSMWAPGAAFFVRIDQMHFSDWMVC